MLAASCTNSAMVRMPSSRRLLRDLADALLVVGMLRQFLDEAAVDLEKVRLQVREQLERIQPRAELLQPDPAVERASRRRRRPAPPAGG